MTRFLIISFIIVLFNSCAFKTTEGLLSVPIKKADIRNPYFSNTEIDYIYKAKIDIYGTYLGGILIIKKVEEDTHRVVFTTEFGNKIFDFSYKGDTFTKNFILEELDKKIVVNTLQKDFKLLISESSRVEEQFGGANQLVYKAKTDNRFNFYFLNKETEALTRIVQTSKWKEKVEILFVSSVNEVAQEIEINHSNINLKISLNYIKNK